MDNPISLADAMIDVLPLIRKAAVMKEYSTSYMANADDLCQEGCAAAIRAYSRFDPDRKGKSGKTMSLRSWLLFKAKHGMEDYLRDVADTLTRTDRTKVKNGGHTPFRVHRFQDVKAMLSPNRSDEMRENYGAFIEDKNAAEPWELCSGVWSERTEQALRTLSARERECIVRYYARGETMNEIATSFGLHEARISQLIAQARELIKRSSAYADFLSADGESDRATPIGLAGRNRRFR
jgi:RNA polymerase sigma factor (sigma-70 family)